MQCSTECYTKKPIITSDWIHDHRASQNQLQNYTLTIQQACWSFRRNVNLYCFKQSNFVDAGTADIYMLVSWDNYLKGFGQDASNHASVSSNVSSERTGWMCSHFCVRHLFTSQHIVHFKLSETLRHQLLYLLQQLLYDFFLILVSTIKPCHTTYFMFINNNNLPMLHAACENKLFWNVVNIHEQFFRWCCVREYDTVQLDMGHAVLYPSV